MNVDDFMGAEAGLLYNDKAFLTHKAQCNSLYTLEQAENFGLVSEPALDYLSSSKGFLPFASSVPFPPPSKAEFSFIDLFAGIGGFRIPLQQLGGKCVFSSEINVHAQKTYFNNFGEYPFGDITKIPLDIIPPHDVLCGGFPCQPFSISGKMRGFEDTRGTLIYNVFKIVDAKKPRVVFLENVKQLVHHDGGRTLDVIVSNFKSLGYELSFKVLNATNFGIPQNRERLILVGHRSLKFSFDKISNSPCGTIRDILDSSENSSFEYLNEPYTLIPNAKKQDSGLIFVGYRNKKIRTVGVRQGTENLSRVHKQPNRIYSVDGVHPTLPSQETSGRFWIYDGSRVRKLTISECYKLMGFPPAFLRDSVLGEAYRQVGNAVCVPMIRAIMSEIKNQLL